MDLSASDYLALEAAALFRSMPLGSLTPHLPSCEIAHCPPGTTLLQPGSANQRIYIVLDGVVSVHLDAPHLPAQTELGAGDCVGEMSLVDGQPVSAWVLSRSHCRLLVMPHAVLWALVERSHAVARNLLAILSGRVRGSNLTLVETQAKSLQFEEVASLDAVTGLHNRRWFMNTIPRVVQRSERDGQTAVLLLADVDRFMQFAALVTPSQQNAALHSIGVQLADVLRAQDMIARLSEDRFAIMLTRTELDECLFIAERLRERVAACQLGPADGAQLLTVSCGLARHHAGDTLEQLLHRAEMALASAKQNGRDCVETAADRP